MSSKLFVIIALAMVCAILSCDRGPSFPDVPKIEFVDIAYKKAVDFTEVDSLLITINIQDGDGDLGLDGIEVDPPYQSSLFFDSSSGATLNEADSAGGYAGVIRYGFLDDDNNIVKTTTLDSLPEYLGESDRGSKCDTYEILDHIVGLDTTSYIVYSQPNPNNKNYLLTFYIKKNGVFEPFDFRTIIPPGSCPIDTKIRFPRFTEASEEGNPLEIELKYGYIDPSWSNIFRNDVLQLEITIIDRALNRSNTVRTNEFTLEQIRIN